MRGSLIRSARGRAQGKHLLAAAFFLSIALSGSATLAERSGTTAGLEQGGAVQDGRDADRRLLDHFRDAQLSLTQAIEVAEGLHRGSRAAAAAFELSEQAAYRVITVKSGKAWENLIDANTGRVIGPELASSLTEFEADQRSNIVALGSVAQELSDAVRVAEKAASGKAFGGGLMREEGRLSFFVVVLSEGELREVRLEPPNAGPRGSVRYRLR